MSEEKDDSQNEAVNEPVNKTTIVHTKREVKPLVLADCLQMERLTAFWEMCSSHQINKFLSIADTQFLMSSESIEFMSDMFRIHNHQSQWKETTHKLIKRDDWLEWPAEIILKRIADFKPSSDIKIFQPKDQAKILAQKVKFDAENYLGTLEFISKFRRITDGQPSQMIIEAIKTFIKEGDTSTIDNKNMFEYLKDKYSGKKECKTFEEFSDTVLGKIQEWNTILKGAVNFLR